MATKPQQSQPGAVEAPKEEQPDYGVGTEGLVQMFKDGTTLGVDPSCVEAHKKAGWVVKP